jgi:hypothetical protein
MTIIKRPDFITFLQRATLLFLTLFVAATLVVLIPYDLGSFDDLLLINRVRHQSIFEIINSSYFYTYKSYYRPILSLTTKLLDTGSFNNPILYRLFQVSLIAGITALFVGLLKKHKIALTSILFGVITLIGTKFNFTAFTWWSDASSLIILVCFFSALTFITNKTQPKSWPLIAIILSLISVFSKELGILVPMLIGCHALVKRNKIVVISMIGIAIFYFSVRYHVLGTMFSHNSFVEDTGIFFTFYNKAELLLRFEGKVFLVYLYNILALGLSLITSQPREGVFTLGGHPFVHIFYLGLFSISTLFIFSVLTKKEYRYSPLVIWCVVSIILNLFVGYNYCRVRTLPIAGSAYCVLIAMSMHITIKKYLNSYSKMLALLITSLFAIWMLNSGLFIGKIVHTDIDHELFLKKHTLPSGKTNDKKLFDKPLFKAETKLLFEK